MAEEAQKGRQNKDISLDLVGENFADLVQIMRELRGENGCPWDKEQTHESLRKYLIEEAYEVIEAIDRKDEEALKEELGDVLLQVIFHAQIAEERGSFDIADVLKSLASKLRSRHPHVFGNEDFETPEEVLRNWEKLKTREKKKGLLEGVSPTLPALIYSYQLQERAARVGFDWKKAQDVWEKVEEEISELKEAVDRGRGVEHELGDLLFSLVNLSRHLGEDPELALKKACERFLSRFSYMEKEAEKEGKHLSELSLEEMDKLWEKSKGGNK